MKNTAYFFITVIAIVVTLIYGKSLLIPFVFALLLWFLVRKIRQSLDRIKFIRKYLPYWFKNVFTSFVLIFILGFVSKILLSNINQLANSYSVYEPNVDMVISNANNLFSIDLISALKGHAGDFDYGSILKKIFNSLTDLLSNAFIIIIYALFIFLEEANFDNKLKGMFKNEYTKLSEILNKIEISIAKYIGLKALLSLITGTLSYIVLAIIGIDAPLFWSFLIFALNFIPTIGSLIATLFPAIFCLLQFGEFNQALMVLVFVGAIQVLVGNLLEPKLMGNSLNISSLVAIFALSFWGVLWGVTGMIISVPITVVMVIIFSNFEKTRPIAILLSDKGNID
jgi:predicted PurR-regulated permease PerM